MHDAAESHTVPWEPPPPEFAAWWWQPRDAAGGPPPADAGPGPGQGQRTAARSLLARRSAAQLAGPSRQGFGAVRSWSWAGLALMAPDRRAHCARLYAALLLCQAPMLNDRLLRLSAADRLWALSIGSIQPVPRRLDWNAHAAQDDATLALAELGFWVREEFPLLWDRLVLDFDPPLRERVDRLMRQSTAAPGCPSGMSGRVRRCWRLAQKKMEDGHEFCQSQGEPA